LVTKVDDCEKSLCFPSLQFNYLGVSHVDKLGMDFSWCVCMGLGRVSVRPRAKTEKNY